jgi:signal transduction histidine kinase
VSTPNSQLLDCSAQKGVSPSPEPHRHAVQFYEKDSSLIDNMSWFIGAGLATGDSAIIVATESHRQALAQSLRARGFDVNRAVSQGRYIALDAASTLAKFTSGDELDSTRFTEVMLTEIAEAQSAAEDKHTVVIFGEMVALLWSENKPEAAIALETLWNNLAQKHSFTLLCGYPMNGFSHQEDNAAFMQICAAHSSVLASEKITAPASAQHRIRAIIDLRKEEQIQEALQGVKRELETEIAERIRVETKLRESEHSLRELTARLLRVQDEERRSIGVKLHEGIGQHLAAAKMGMDLLAHAESSIAPEISRSITDCAKLVELSIAEIRAMAHLLYPPLLEELGLSVAIPWCLDGFAKRSGIKAELEMAATVGRLPREVEIAIFRVLQECLINIQQHSLYASVRVRFSSQENLAKLEITDSGKGQPVMGIELQAIIERLRQIGGKLGLESSHEGATVIATVPFANHHPVS